MEGERFLKRQYLFNNKDLDLDCEITLWSGTVLLLRRELDNMHACTFTTEGNWEQFFSSVIIAVTRTSGGSG